MSSFDVGDLIRITANVIDLANDPIDPSGFKLYIKRPNAVITTLIFNTDPEIVKDTVGQYHIDLSVDLAGLWYVRWEATGTGQSAEEDSFYVQSTRF